MELEIISLLIDNAPTICEYVPQDLNAGKVSKSEWLALPDGLYRLVLPYGCVSWVLSSSLSTEMVLTALGRGIHNRRPGAGLIIHSDRGVQYASKDFRKDLGKHHFVQSMSRKDDCWERETCPWGITP